MILDCHGHIGKSNHFHLSKEVLIASMNKYHIDFSLVSNIAAAEVDNHQVVFPANFQHSQYDTNLELIEFAKAYPSQIGALLWIKPLTEQCDEQFERLITQNRHYIYGLKMHPFYSKLAFNDPKVEPYLKLAEKYDLVVVTHTASDFESQPKHVYEMAKKYPRVNFVMYHMELESDNERAIQYIKELPNLYGDTAWVRPDKVKRAIEICGKHKILFGSDNPVDGLDTYHHPEFYTCYFETPQSFLSQDEYEHLMYKNAMQLFKIKR